MNNERALNWSVGILVFLEIFVRVWLEKHLPSLHWFFVFCPLVLLVWSAGISFRRLSLGEASTSFPHQRLLPEDFYRVFFILFAGHYSLAAKHILGFYIFSAIAICLVFFLVTIVGVELFQRRGLNGWVLGCGLFVYCLFSWERHMFVEHFGVPIVGHFFEKPEYDARYYVEAERDGSKQKFRFQADIHVEGRSETDEVGEDRFGMSIFETTHFRDIWIRRLHYPNGRSVTIEDQDGPLHLGDSVSVTDANGNNWNIKLLKEQAH